MVENTKVCFVVSEYVSPTRGGVERVTYTLARELQLHNVGVHIVCAKPPLTREELNKDIRVLPEDHSNWQDFLRELLEGQHIDIIVNQSHEMALFELCRAVASQRRCKLITTIHSDPLSAIKGIADIDVESRYLLDKTTRIISTIKWLVRYPYRYFCRKKYIARKYRYVYDNSDATVLLSSKFKKNFIKLSGIKDCPKLRAISNPVELGDGHPGGKAKVLLFVGRMEFSAKRPDRIVRIWEKLYQRHLDWRLIMVGEGPAKSVLLKYCKDRGIKNIEFVGRVNPATYYQSGSILCVTSTYEGFGLVIVEAQNYNVIPVAYDSYEALRDLIENGQTGFLVKAFDERSYILTLERLMNDFELREGIKGKQNFSVTKHKFSVSRIAEEWVNLFNALNAKK